MTTSSWLDSWPTALDLVGKYDQKRPPDYKTEDKGDSFKDFINRHCGGEENLFQPVNGQSALEYAGLAGAESIGQSLSGIQRNIFQSLCLIVTHWYGFEKLPR